MTSKGGARWNSKHRFYGVEQISLNHIPASFNTEVVHVSTTVKVTLPTERTACITKLEEVLPTISKYVRAIGSANVTPATTTSEDARV